MHSAGQLQIEIIPTQANWTGVTPAVCEARLATSALHLATAFHSSLNICACHACQADQQISGT